MFEKTKIFFFRTRTNTCLGQKIDFLEAKTGFWRPINRINLDLFRSKIDFSWKNVLFRWKLDIKKAHQRLLETKKDIWRPKKAFGNQKRLLEKGFWKPKKTFEDQKGFWRL